MNDRHLEEVFLKLWGQAMPEEERKRLMRLRDALGIDNNDALWTVLLALRHHLQLYEAIPDKIASTTKEVLDGTRESADATIRASTADIQRTLTREVSQAVRGISRTVYRSELMEKLIYSVAVFAVAFGAFGWYMHKQGKESGYDQGWSLAYRLAQDEKAAASWGNTAEGKRARHLAKIGSLTMLFECSGKGWTIEKGYCYPTSSNGSVYGWRIAK